MKVCTVEEGRVPDGPLANMMATRAKSNDLHVAPLAERLGVEALWRLWALGLHLGEGRALRQLQAHPDGDGQQAGGEQERDAPAPGVEGLGPKKWPTIRPRDQDHQQGREEAERRGGLDPARRAAASGRGRVLGHRDRRAAVFAAEGEALDDAHQHQQGRPSRPTWA